MTKCSKYSRAIPASLNAASYLVHDALGSELVLHFKKALPRESLVQGQPLVGSPVA